MGGARTGAQSARKADNISQQPRLLCGNARVQERPQQSFQPTGSEVAHVMEIQSVSTL